MADVVTPRKRATSAPLTPSCLTAARQKIPRARLTSRRRLPDRRSDSGGPVGLVTFRARVPRSGPSPAQRRVCLVRSATPARRRSTNAPHPGSARLRGPPPCRGRPPAAGSPRRLPPSGRVGSRRGCDPSRGAGPRPKVPDEVRKRVEAGGAGHRRTIGPAERTVKVLSAPFSHPLFLTTGRRSGSSRSLKSSHGSAWRSAWRAGSRRTVCSLS